jgi:hypothetical protein
LSEPSPIPRVALPAAGSATAGLHRHLFVITVRVDITTEAKATSSSSIKPDGLYLPLSLPLSLLIYVMFYSIYSKY